jgi:hypothetical protein
LEIRERRVRERRSATGVRERGPRAPIPRSVSL